MLSNSRTLFIRRGAGAVVASVAVATIFSTVGYSDGASVSDFLREISIAFCSYVSAALLVQWIARSESVWWDIAGISFLGSVISFPLKLVFLEGENGIPAYLARVASEHSWKPFADLVTHGIGFIVLATLITLPFVAGAVSLWYLSSRVVKSRN